MKEKEDPHVKHNKVIFTAFCKSTQNFSPMIPLTRYPSGNEQFPDVEVTMPDGTKVLWEIGAWLDQEQMKASMQMQQVMKKIQAAVKEFSNNFENILRCTLLLKSNPEQFRNSDRRNFESEFKQLLLDVDQSSMLMGNATEKYYVFSNLDAYSTMSRFVKLIWFWRKVVQGQEVSWSPSLPWIMIQDPGGSYDPGQAVKALKNILEKKTSHYGDFKNLDVRLIVHYDEAFVHNTPYEGVEHQTFANVAELGNQILNDLEVPFKEVYLLHTLKHQVFRIFPDFVDFDI